jgi:hypothetical protein
MQEVHPTESDGQQVDKLAKIVHESMFGWPEQHWFAFLEAGWFYITVVQIPHN